MRFIAPLIASIVVLVILWLLGSIVGSILFGAYCLFTGYNPWA